jgi:aspartate kinase
MNVFKFGGASISNPERIRETAEIIRAHGDGPLLVVISALGKTTNALEEVVNAYYGGQLEQARNLFDAICDTHKLIAGELGVAEAAREALINVITEVSWLLHDQPTGSYDYCYDQVVCSGELMSTVIVSQYLKQAGIANTWIDVRDVIRTDDNFRDASIDWAFTGQQTQKILKPLFGPTSIVVTQGFIGATDENESTTLGREGSDYTAAVFANLLDAESLTIWKDVEGVMNADPKKFPGAEIMNTLSFNEVIEMAYYGAQVIHPKTIKPLQNKAIPLHVRCFLRPEAPGTLIGAQAIRNLPPVIILKENQVLISFRMKDFSFIGEQGAARLYECFAEVKISPNIIQSGAIGMWCGFDDKPEKISQLALKTGEQFEVMVEKGLTLLTIRHYLPGQTEEMTTGKTIILRQQTTETVQLLMKEQK